jgi:hypothetical protein
VSVAGIAAVLAALLFDRAGIAIAIATSIVPLAVVAELRRMDRTDDEPRWGMPVALLWGWSVGVVAGGIGVFAVDQLWYESPGINAGAVGFGGAAAQAAGSPPLSLLFLHGIVLTMSAAVVTFAGPLALRRSERFRDDLLDGLGIGAAAGSAFGAGAAVVGFWPLLTGSPPQSSVGDWTALLIGALLTRPLIYGLALAIACAGIWRARVDGRQDVAALPVTAAIAGLVVFALGDLFAQARGPRLELAWHAVSLIGLWSLFRATARDALQQEQLLADASGSRIRCPACGAFTTEGGYCSTCGARLAPPAIAAASIEVDVPEPSEIAEPASVTTVDVEPGERPVSSR